MQSITGVVVEEYNVLTVDSTYWGTSLLGQPHYWAILARMKLCQYNTVQHVTAYRGSILVFWANQWMNST